MEPTENKEKLLKTDQSGTGKVNDRKVKKLDGYVGFANLPNQVYRKAVKKGFEFTLMVVGKFIRILHRFKFCFGILVFTTCHIYLLTI